MDQETWAVLSGWMDIHCRDTAIDHVRTLFEPVNPTGVLPQFARLRWRHPADDPYRVDIVARVDGVAPFDMTGSIAQMI